MRLPFLFFSLSFFGNACRLRQRKNQANYLQETERYRCVIYSRLFFLVWFLFNFITIIKRLQKAIQRS